MEVAAVLGAARKENVSLTFRAAGTSLSGQAVSDSMLVVLGPSWTGHRIEEGGARIRLRPGVLGARANRLLAAYGRKIGPDPASIDSAKIGGIAANNASGMCCGTAQNSYRTLAGMRIIFADGTLLDTSDVASREEFLHARGDLAAGITALARRARANEALSERIRRKYRMKNTTGYSLNALVDFDDPIDIIQHLMIGSEGTLGFIAEVSYHTVPEHPCKASALLLFPDIVTACRAVVRLTTAPVDAVELMDRPSLSSVEEKHGMPPFLRELDRDVAALLVETRAPHADELRSRIETITRAIDDLPTVGPRAFTDRPEEYEVLWNIRKGLFPSVGAMRATGTTVIIEDVAFPIDRLAEATDELRGLFVKHGYHDAIIFGHALEGNLHFVFKQDFNSGQEVRRYDGFLRDMCDMVVRKYDGSLKAEHGTGRNMAPFVELEWGREAYDLMKEIKALFDPRGLLNPGVILNADAEAHLRNLKPLPPADPIVDKCIECGFCDVHCPSKDLTLTPRQRIVAYREIARLRRDNGDGERLAKLEKAFRYYGDQTCATDGLCATRCPVEIDTGTLIKELRRRSVSPLASAIATLLARNMAAVTGLMRLLLNLLDGVHGVLGTRAMGGLAATARRVSGGVIPEWNPYMPRGADRVGIIDPGIIDPGIIDPRIIDPRVVYFPSCINRTMGCARGDGATRSLTTVTRDLLHKAGYGIVFPARLDTLCCGMAFASKGFTSQGNRKADELEEALRCASEDGRLPILVDMSPCLYRMRERFGPGLRLYDPVLFALEHMVPRLALRRIPGTVTVHTTCSARKMGLAAATVRLASLCAEKVVVPDDIECCGWAGDRGFTFPELNASALRSLKNSLPAGCTHGYSTSRTCEIGLSLHSGIQYESILTLLDVCSTGRGHAGEVKAGAALQGT
jgi:D-lactate dehydrogenase